ncbi:hypothetical protein Ahy_B02g058668 [Arachis hypogaea]|uniref:Ribosomal RNA small subunit methyltransferase NEP1 n=1 Tax=Arachis hypogaea TaxID=3818 RepID=A0A445AF22_ARAHY|nr:hypothetical protein Ahy_B02g058668 [Arachis hypogaea]
MRSHSFSHTGSSAHTFRRRRLFWTCGFWFAVDLLVLVWYPRRCCHLVAGLPFVSPRDCEEEEESRERDSKIGAVDKVFGSPQDHNVRSRAIFILENASLKKGLVRKALRSIMDSPLNKYGLVGSIFVKIDGGSLFEIKPHVCIPRTCKRFCGLIGLSYSSEMLVDIDDYVGALSDAVTPIFVVGAMVNGKVKRDNTHDYISVSDYPLGAKCCVGLICDALEQKWKLF